MGSLRAFLCAASVLGCIAGAADVRDKMLNLGAEPVGSKPDEFAAYIRSESEKYARVIRASGAKAD